MFKIRVTLSKNIGLVIVFTISLIVFSKCKHKIEDAPIKPLPAVVSFSNDIQPLFNANCVQSGCHSGNLPASGLNLTVSNSYHNLFNKKEIDTITPTMSPLYIFMNSTMPPSGKLDSYDISIVLKWTEQGARNN